VAKKESKLLQALLTQDELLEMAGSRYFARGEDYVRRGYVHDLAIEGNTLTACVTGAENYEVELWVEEDELQSSCTCPLGVDDIFCKHCVAVGLVWLANPKAAKPQKSDSSVEKPVTFQEVQQFVEEQEKSTLVRWILDRVQRDEGWRQQFFLKVASQRSQGLDLTTFRRALGDAIVVRDFIDWDEVSEYADGISSVFSSIQDLLETHPNAVIELCATAIPMMEKAMNSVDDSNGEMGSILEEFVELHYEACDLAKPDPIQLAEFLFHSEINSDFGSFSGAVSIYGNLLGAQGLAYYQQRAESMWQEFPTLTSKDESKWNYKRNKLQRILENLAHQKGDLEAVVAIKQRDLSSARTYLEIAELYFQDGQRDRALEWAESGLKAFENLDGRLKEFVIEEYHRRGRIEDALELAWQAFTHSVTLYSYQQLKTQTERATQWAIWRDKALAYIRQLLDPQIPPKSVKAKGKRETSSSNLNLYSRIGRDRSLLVEIFLWEGEDELAWQEAQAGGCSKQLWLKLADRRQHTHPEDALPIYQREIEPLVQQTNNAAYDNALSFLIKVRELMLRLNQQAEFNALVTHLRQTYKAKRNFMALLNQQKW
jgi:uncharacterized Zn finger protein